MHEERKDPYKIAGVILLIIKHEGEIEDVIEYPAEFEEAYKDLLNYKIIQAGEGGKYVKGENFEKAMRLGLSSYIEKQEAKPAPPSKLKTYIQSKPALGIFAGAIFLTAAFLISSDKKNTGQNQNKLHPGDPAGTT